MTKFKDFPVYGVSDIDGKPIALGHENHYGLLIEFNYASALNTAKNLVAIAKSQEMQGENYSSQVRIIKLFNISEIQDFQKSYDWKSENDSSGYLQLKFTQDKLPGGPDIKKIKFHPWEDEESF